MRQSRRLSLESFSMIGIEKVEGMVVELEEEGFTIACWMF
jgi:hypothetical protein